MYLFVFVFLLLTIIGVFTQVFAVQTARFSANQAVAGQQMLAWHYAATRFARAHPTYGLTQTGCRITGGATLYSGLTLTTACSTTLAASDLPTGYVVSYQWESIVFTDPGTSQRMVVTFVPPDANDAQAPRAPAGLAINQILTQLRKAQPGSITSGSISGACPGSIMVPASQPGGSFVTQYPVPKSAAAPVTCYVPVGSVASYTVL
ncbi:MAG: hypothetical protein GC131_07090 [Alphaproteobacteria bacterium]|nr:hypothetical protein [Alphaproteobacteria bacterium]